ncbi:MAG: VTT domain-containing protein [Flavisolibacter sp.]
MAYLHMNQQFLFLFGIHVEEWISHYGVWVYAIMFLFIFCETGLVVTPVLPGDSMIFAAATLSAREQTVLNVHLIALLMTLAAFSGDVVNYSIGKFLGPKVYRKNFRIINRARLDNTRRYFRKHGVRTIVYARFVPLIRTFAPFVAGVSEMDYKRFMFFNFLGGLSWVCIYAYGGYFLGNIKFVKEHFETTVLIVLVLTLLPVVYGFLRAQLKNRKGKRSAR